MSFSSDVKNELCKVRISGCCKFSELYGFLLFSRNFSYSSINIKTEHYAVAKRFLKLLKLCFSIEAELIQTAGAHKVLIENESDRKMICDRFDRFESNGFSCENCMGAFIRGAFLASGSIADPEKNFHTEFLTSNTQSGELLKKVLTVLGIAPKTSLRQKKSVIYFKEGDAISDLLTVMNASKYSLELIGVKIVKQIRNNANRVANCEAANISRTADAALKHIIAVKKLQKHHKIEGLSDELQQTAKLRLEYPEASLRELAEMCGTTRSGINHRLQKLERLANEEK